MTSRRSVLATGYVALDVVIHDGSVRHRAGGTAANVAANLAYFGWSTQLLARLGRDARATRIVHDLRAEGADNSHVERDPSLDTPVVIHEVDPPEHRFRFVCPGCEQRLPTHRPPTADQVEVWAEQGIPGGHPDVFFFDRASAPALDLAQRLRDAGSVVVFEPSTGNADRMMRAAEIAHAVKCSAERRAFMPEELLTARSDQRQIETRGADGLRFRLGTAGWQSLAAVEVDVVDSAGAGDWLTAGFLYSLAPLNFNSRARVANALQVGQAIAALSCRLAGARSLSGTKRSALVHAARRASAGEEAGELRPRLTRRSRASGVCSLCLGRLDVTQ